MNDPKLIYLDQNKWIQLARVVHGKDTSPELKRTALNLRRATKAGHVRTPLSAIHYMETARITCPDRRRRLGEVMWAYSRGSTTSDNRTVVVHELRSALAELGVAVANPPFEFIGYGIKHAFGNKLSHDIPKHLQERVEHGLITGSGPKGWHAPAYRNDTHQMTFLKHLQDLPSLKQRLPKEKLYDALHAIALYDIQEPLSLVLDEAKISLADIGDITRARKFVMSMPSRALDIHLHQQMLKNSDLKPKKTDLEDWAGLGIACQYCDLVVCEKQFADLVGRDNFAVKATILTDIKALQDFI